MKAEGEVGPSWVRWAAVGQEKSDPGRPQAEAPEVNDWREWRGAAAQRRSWKDTRSPTPRGCVDHIKDFECYSTRIGEPLMESEKEIF